MSNYHVYPIHVRNMTKIYILIETDKYSEPKIQTYRAINRKVTKDHICEDVISSRY